jgi:hypothetical protein
MRRVLWAALALLAAAFPVLALDATQNDWSGGGGEPGPIDHWGRKFDAQTDVDWSGDPGNLSLGKLAQEILVSGALMQPNTVIAARIDADDDMDVVVSSSDYSAIVWYENTDGSGGAWASHLVSQTAAQYLELADVDGDGDTDILYASYGSLGWRENDGDGVSWSSHYIYNTSGTVTSIYAADMDGDDDTDVFATADTGEVIWWSNDDGSGGSWTQHTITSGFLGASSVFAADVDGDDDLDVVAAGGGWVAWYSNNDGAGTSWSRHMINDQYYGASSVYAADIDGDTDIDVVATCSMIDRIAWWANSDGVGGSWTMKMIQDGFGGAESVVARDLDGDTDTDIAAAASGDDEVTWWENVDGSGGTLTKHVLNTNFGGACFVYVEDVNGDGMNDVVCCAGDANETRWWNLTTLAPSGDLISSILDVTAETEWGWAMWDAETPSGTNVRLSVRASDDSGDMGSWSDVSWGADLGDLYPTMRDYLQYRVWLTTADLQVSPTFSMLSICPYFHLLSPAKGAVVDTLTPTLDWGDTVLPDFDTYTLWWGTDPTFADYNEVPSIVDSTYRIASGVADGDVIYWRVKALDTSAREIWAPERDWSFTVDLGGGVDVVDFGAGATDGGVLVNWRLSGEEPFTVRVLRGTGEAEMISGNLPGDSSRYLDRDVEPGGSYAYWLEVVEADGTVSRFGPTEAVTVPGETPEFALYAAYPSPSRDVVNFAYSMPEDGRVVLSVYDLSGRRVATLVNDELTAGRHDVAWDCASAPSGVYLVRLSAPSGVATNRVVVAR